LPFGRAAARTRRRGRDARWADDGTNDDEDCERGFTCGSREQSEGAEDERNGDAEDDRIADAGGAVSRERFGGWTEERRGVPECSEPKGGGGSVVVRGMRRVGGW
jgi:hypothetical protein